MSVRQTLLRRVAQERERQDEKWGSERHYPLVSGKEERDHYESVESYYKHKLSKARPEAGEVTWHDILMEEIAEAMAESDHGLIIEELIQVAAVALAICEDITLRGLVDNG